jgi:hypothetical protein
MVFQTNIILQGYTDPCLEINHARCALCSVELSWNPSSAIQRRVTVMGGAVELP